MSRQTIIEKTRGEIRTFLDEISNGTSNYRGLHNLTEQIEHQYHGRFLIELLQNAHDALFKPEESGSTQRIEVRLVSEEGKHGVLYVANDGKPFSESNFRALSNLGQSDKDPNDAIGNKGIGFRSVLEVCREPEIYSRRCSESTNFDGYTFRFSPHILSRYQTAIEKLAAGDANATCPLSHEQPLVIWSQPRLVAFQQRCQSLGNGWLETESSYLSPYALPAPIEESEFNSTINDFSEQGFESVIRLELISDDAREMASQGIHGISAEGIIFLRRLNELRLIDGDNQRRLCRTTNPREDKNHGREIQIATKASNTDAETPALHQRYWIWRRTIGGEKDMQGAEQIAEAVVSLPGKWPDLRRATVEVAVRLDANSTVGNLCIFLPTHMGATTTRITQWRHSGPPDLVKPATNDNTRNLPRLLRQTRGDGKTGQTVAGQTYFTQRAKSS